MTLDEITDRIKAADPHNGDDVMTVLMAMHDYLRERESARNETYEGRLEKLRWWTTTDETVEDAYDGDEHKLAAVVRELLAERDQLFEQRRRSQGNCIARECEEKQDALKRRVHQLESARGEAVAEERKAWKAAFDRLAKERDNLLADVERLTKERDDIRSRNAFLDEHCRQVELAADKLRDDAVAAEREACAKECDKLVFPPDDGDPIREAASETAHECAARIRAREQKEKA